MQNIKPHWGWFLLGPAVLILGGIASVVLMAGGLMSVAEGMQRVDAPGEAVIRIEQPGEQAIFFEQRGVAAASAPADLKLSITPLAGGEPLSISNTFGSVTYNANGVAGRNYGSVNFPERASTRWWWRRLQAAGRLRWEVTRARKLWVRCSGSLAWGSARLSPA